MVHKVDWDELHLGKSVVFKLMKEEIKISYNLRGYLKERIITLKFMTALMTEKKVTINGAELEIYPTSSEVKSLQKERMRKQIEHLCDVRDILDHLGVREDLDCDNLDEKDEDYIRMLLLAFKYNQRIGFIDRELPPIGYIKLGNLHIMFHFKEQDDGKYKLENFIDCQMDCSSDYSDGTMFKTSKYTILIEEDFNIISNLDYEEIIKDVKKYENKGNYIRTNVMMLEMLKSYDKKKNKLLLKATTDIASWLFQKNDDYEIALLNLYQCYYRQRKLEKEEENSLLDIVENQKDNNAFIVGAYILLGEEKMAERYFKKLTTEEQENFKLFPIYTLEKKSKVIHG